MMVWSFANLNDPDNHDGVIIPLQPDILECKVKWALGSITTNKASRGDGIPLYRASPSLAAKNIINLILVLTIWWCPCVESSLVLLEESVCYDQCVLLAKLLAFALLHFVLRGQICRLRQLSLDFLLLHSSPLWWKRHLFWGVSSRRSWRSS